jgi:hypothetical protein
MRGRSGCGSQLGQSGDYRIREVARSRRTAEIVRDGSAFGEDRPDGVLDSPGSGLLADVPEE